MIAIQKLKLQEMIFWQPFCDNLCDNFISHTHIIFLLSLSITLVSVSLSNFLYKLVVVTKVITQTVVQITHLIAYWSITPVRKRSIKSSSLNFAELCIESHSQRTMQVQCGIGWKISNSSQKLWTIGEISEFKIQQRTKML